MYETVITPFWAIGVGSLDTVLHKAGAPRPCMESMDFDGMNQVCLGGSVECVYREESDLAAVRERMFMKTPPWKSRTQYTGGTLRGRWARMTDRWVTKDSLL